MTDRRKEKDLTDRGAEHSLPPEWTDAPIRPGLNDWSDMVSLQDADPSSGVWHTRIQSIDDLLSRDKQREKDGFPRKIRVGRLIKPGQGGPDKIVVVPTTVEEKLLHDKIRLNNEEQSGGSGEGGEGEVVGEEPIRQQGPGQGGAGQGQGGPHEMESSAYDLGRILTEQFELPNLKDKGKKRSLTNYTYDLTDRHRGAGQVLDKKATLRRIVETNIALGRIAPASEVNPSDFLVSPDDLVYRILSREADYESQALVFFVRDYSGSMSGKPTELVVSQHVLIYSWLLYQYSRQVETRFILHDTEAKEAPDFFTYYNSKVAGGTKVAAAYELVNQIIDRESLYQDYNIYVFHGTDGDDWDKEGKETIPQLKAMLTKVNRVGVTIVEPATGPAHNSELEKVINESKLPIQHPDLIRLDSFNESADEPRLIEGIKKLISE